MKYIITESQYNNAIDRFITYKFEPHKEVPSGYKNIYWIKDDGEIVVNFDFHRKGVYISSTIWRDVSRMFSLDHNDVRDSFAEWFELHSILNLSGLKILSMGASPYVGSAFLRTLD